LVSFQTKTKKIILIKKLIYFYLRPRSSSEVLDMFIHDDPECHYFGIVVAHEFSKKVYQEARSSPHPIRLSSENTIVKDVALSWGS